MCAVGKKNLVEWLQISKFFDAQTCQECTSEEDQREDFIDGLPPCEAGCFSCKHLDREYRRTGLKGNPWHRISAGGLRESMETFETVCALSQRDSVRLPTLEAFGYYSDSIACSEKAFWKMMSMLLSDRRNECVTNMKRNDDNG